MSTTLSEAVLMSTHNLCLSRNMINISFFLSKKIKFLEVKFSIYGKCSKISNKIK